MKTKIFSIMIALVLVFGLSLTMAVPAAASTTLNVPAPYATIQAAINAASSGDTIVVAAGTYTDGFSIVNKTNLTIVGAGAATTIIAPTSVINTGVGHKYRTPTQAVVFISNSTGISIQGVTIQSTLAAPDGGGPDAIVFWNASSGTIGNCKIQGIYAISGTQSGQGLAVDASGIQTTTLAVNNTDISGAQKNAIDIVDGNGVAGGSTDTIIVNVTGGSINGAGPTSTIAQNGILFWNMGGGALSGTITGVTISGFNYTPPSDQATGILNYCTSGGVTTISGCSFVGDELALDNESSSPINAENNWWGTTNPIAIVALISGANVAGVDYTPYLNAAPTTTTVQGSLTASLHLSVQSGNPTVEIVKSPAMPSQDGNGKATNDAAVTAAVAGVPPILATLTNTGSGASDPVRINPIGASSHIQLWAFDTTSNHWFNTNVSGWGDTAGFSIPAGASITTNVYAISDLADTYNATATVQDIATSSLYSPAASATAIILVDPIFISIAAPPTLTFSSFSPGQFNYGTSTGGTVVSNSAAVSWTVNGLGGKKMTNQNNVALFYPLLISPTVGPWNPADAIDATIPLGGTTYTGEYSTGGNGPGAFDLHAAQYIVATDAAGNYSDVITFTVNYTP